MCYIKNVLYKNRVMTAAYIVMGIFSAFMINYKALCFRKVIDALTDRTLTFGGIAAYGGVLLIVYGMGYLDQYPEKKLEHGIYLDFKLLALRKISTIDYLEYSKIGTGRLVQQIENGAAAGRNVVFHFWIVLVRELFPAVLFSICFIWKINRSVTYVLLGGYIVIFIVTNILLKFLYRIKEKVLDNEELLNHYLVRGFMEMSLFRLGRQFPGEIKKAERAKNIIVASKVKMNMIHEAFFTIFVLLVSALDIGILFYAWHDRSLSVGSVVALVTLIENAYMPIAIFNVIYVQYRLDKASYARFEAFLHTADDERLYEGRRLDREIGEILVKDLSFRYGEESVFDGLNLSVKRGEKVAFVGESGSGKSTFVKILAGLLKYDTGHVFWGGLELKDLCLDDLYGRIAYLSQDAPVFDGTIRENLVFDKQEEDGQMIEALERVQLSDLLLKNELGLEAEIGERGACLSGGEKQRLALARLWFESPEVVILDEATSAMDNLTEENVMEEIIRRFKKQTVIAVAHRLNAVRDFDRIVVFKDGKIAGEGTFEGLMRENGYFAQLYRAGMS